MLAVPVFGQTVSNDRDQAAAEVIELARELDAVLGQNFRAANRDPPENERIELRPRISDAGFLRRVYLILLGRNPSVEETRAFLGLDRKSVPDQLDDLPNRHELVLSLTESTEFARQEFRRWISRLKLDPNPGHPAQAWLLSQFEKGISLDEWTKEWFGKFTVPFVAPTAPGSSAVDLVQAANWLGAFVGGGLECAVCHDHPYENLEQGHVVRLAGFLNDQGAIRLPDPYYYDDGKPGMPVPASTFFGMYPLKAFPETRRFGERIGSEPWPDIDSAQMFGDWLVQPESVAFDENIVNRAWKRIFGLELFHDSFSDQSRKPAEERLVSVLVRILHAVEYDYRRFLEVLLLSRVAQLESVSWDTGRQIWTKKILAGPITRELSHDERERSLTLLETGQTDPDLESWLNSSHFQPEAAWLTSAEIERRVSGNPLAVIWREIETARSDEEAWARILLATVVRKPGEEEFAEIPGLLGDADEARKTRMARALWALLLSEEFAWVP